MTTVVFAPGCWDLLHFGHLTLLARASAMGDRLIVGLNTDASVKRLKGISRPIVAYQQRYECLMAVRWVDEVIPILDDTPCNLIRRLKPEIVIKGPGYSMDRMAEASVVESYGGRIVFLNGPDVSTTQILQRLNHDALSDRRDLGERED